jgi:hypothetical protein
MILCWQACGEGYQASQSLNVFHGDLIGTESKHTPTGQTRLQIFLQISVEPGGAVVAAVHPDTALDLNQHTGFHLRKIGPPTPLVMEAVFSLQVRPLDVVPEHQKAFFESRGRFGGTIAQAGHGLRGESIRREMKVD